jgi:hypothetical protein
MSSTIKGDVAPGDTLFVDVYRAPVVSSEDLNATKPTEAVTLFLKPAHFDHDVLKYEINEAIEGQNLLKLRTPHRSLPASHECGRAEDHLLVRLGSLQPRQRVTRHG